jgi:hypothetical protein
MSRLERRVAALESKTVIDPLNNLTDEQLDARIRELAQEILNHPDSAAEDVAHAQGVLGKLNADGLIK